MVCSQRLSSGGGAGRRNRWYVSERVWLFLGDCSNRQAVFVLLRGLLTPVKEISLTSLPVHGVGHLSPAQQRSWIFTTFEEKIKINVEINAIESTWMGEINKVNTCFFNKINKCDKLLPTLIARKRRDRPVMPSAGEDGGRVRGLGPHCWDGRAALQSSVAVSRAVRHGLTMTQQSIPGCVPKREKNVCSLRGLHMCWQQPCS